MAATLEKTYSNSKFKDPEWYTALAVDFLDFKWGALAKDLGKALKPETQNTAKELSQLFVDAFNNCHAAEKHQAKVKKQYHQTFTDQQLDPDFPTYHRLFHILLNQLKDAKFKAGEFSLEDNWISELRVNFSNEFAELIRLDSEKYPAACKYIAQLKIGDSVESKVIRHINDLLYEVEQEPLTIDQQLTLQQSYVSPDCKSKVEPVPNRSGEKPAEQESECLIGTLLNHIQNSTDPLVLHGQPGHGKTSSVKMLARTITGLYKEVAAPPITLLFEFKQLGNLNRSFVDILNQQTGFITEESFFDGKNTVLILDGLDERQATDGSSDQNLKNFITEMFYFAAKVNKKADSRLNLIVTGRSQYVGQIQSCFNKTHTVIDITDFNEHKREVWLSKFNQQKRLADGNELNAEDFEKYKLSELVSQPILLSISSIMLTDPDGKALIEEFKGEEINRALIYRTIIEWSYDKRWQEGGHAEDWKEKLDFDDYFKLLQAIAFEMVRAGKETIRLTQLAKALEENAKNIFDLDAIGSMGLDELEKLCAQLRISFFFKGVEEKAFAFIHKSFKDFLLVSGIVDATPALFADFNVKKPERTDADLIALFGQKPFSEGDHAEFMLEWLSVQQESLCNFAQTANVIWSRIAEQQIKVEETVAFKQLKVMAITTFNYLQIVSRWFPMLPKQIREDIFDLDGYIELFGLEVFERVEYLLSHESLKHTNFQLQYLGGLDFKHRYFNCYFFMAHFDGCWFEHSIFDLCNFNQSRFDACRAENVAFVDCDFREVETCELSFADYDGLKSQLIRCDFQESNLIFSIESSNKCYFVDCYFEDSNTEHSDKLTIQNTK